MLIIRFSKTKIQAFLEALHPVQFAFRFKFLRARADEKIGCEEICNRKTGEKLSIVCFAADDDYDSIGHTLEIKRSTAEEKKGL